MARGGHRSGTGLPLRDRIRTDTPATLTAGEYRKPTNAEPSPLIGPARHCWVLAPIDGLGARPGLLVEWRHHERWEGRVHYAAQLRPGEWSVVEEWVHAELLQPQPSGHAGLIELYDSPSGIRRWRRNQ